MQLFNLVSIFFLIVFCDGISRPRYYNARYESIEDVEPKEYELKKYPELYQRHLNENAQIILFYKTPVFQRSVGVNNSGPKNWSGPENLSVAGKFQGPRRVKNIMRSRQRNASGRVWNELLLILKDYNKIYYNYY